MLINILKKEIQNNDAAKYNGKVMTETGKVVRSAVDTVILHAEKVGKKYIKMSEKIIPGDIFYFETENKKKYIFGRVLFDVDEQLKKEKVNDESYFTTYSGCQLIEIYKGIYDFPNLPDSIEVLIPRVFVFKIDSKTNSINWGKVGHKNIDIKKIEFPEVVGNAYNEVRLMRGELFFKTSIEDPIEFPGILPTPEYPVVILDASLGLQNREDLIEGDYYSESLTDLDLLYHKKDRKKIYTDLGIDPNKSYYELIIKGNGI